MNRTAAFAALALPIAFAAPALAQQPDFSQVEIVATEVGPNLWALEGQGGRIGVLAGPEGVLMVDSQFAPLGDKIIAAIGAISDAPIRFLVNTHVHGDHTSGNANFGSIGATIMARPQLRERLVAPVAPPGGNAPEPTPAAALPVVTYDAETTVHLNGETVHLIPLPLAHTDGDTAIHFVNANALMTGDVFRSVGYPNIDRTNGGSLDGLLGGLQTMLEIAGPETRILPGHGPVTDEAAIQAHYDMIISVRDAIAPMIAEGKTVEEVVAARPTASFDEKVGNPQSADRFVTQLYAELKG